MIPVIRRFWWMWPQKSSAFLLCVGRNAYLCTIKTSIAREESLSDSKKSESSAVGSALRSGRRGRAFESPLSDINFSGDVAKLIFAASPFFHQKVKCKALKWKLKEACWSRWPKHYPKTYTLFRTIPLECVMAWNVRLLEVFNGWKRKSKREWGVNFLY